jgi:hypothetical protein
VASLYFLVEVQAWGLRPPRREEFKMELDFAVLADGAQPRPDGKLDIYGAGIDGVQAPSFPFVLGVPLHVALRIRLAPEEAETEHQLHVDLVDPEGVARMPTARVPIRVPDQIAGTTPVGDATIGVGYLIDLRGVRFVAPGPHEIIVRRDGREITRLRLDVRRIVSPQAAAA